jgi:HEAT repeat protein
LVKGKEAKEGFAMRWTILAGVAPALLWLVASSSGQDRSMEKGEKPPPKYKVGSILGKNLSQWVEEIKDRDKGKAENAIRTVILFGQQDAQRAVPVMVAEMKKPPPIDTSIRVNITIALGVILSGDPKEFDFNPKDKQDAVAVLKRALTDNQSIVKMRAAEALGRMGWDARDAVPALILTSKDQFTWETRCASALALGAVARDPEGKTRPDKNAIQALYNLLQDETAQVKLAAVKSLAQLGPHKDKEDLKLLNRYLDPVALKDRDKSVRVWAEMTLMASNGVDEKRLRHIGTLLHSPDDVTARVQAANALGRVGQEAASQVDNLLKALKDSDEEVVGWAAWALGRMGTKARPAIPVLQMMIKTDNRNLKQQFEQSIDAIEGKTKSPDKKGSLTCPDPPWFRSSPLYASLWAPEVYTPSHVFWARIAATGRRS